LENERRGGGRLSWDLAGLRWLRGEFEAGCEMRLTLGHQSRNLIEHD
jgi:hypothetical protein